MNDFGYVHQFHRFLCLCHVKCCHFHHFFRCIIIFTMPMIFISIIFVFINVIFFVVFLTWMFTAFINFFFLTPFCRDKVSRTCFINLIGFFPPSFSPSLTSSFSSTFIIFIKFITSIPFIHFMVSITFIIFNIFFSGSPYFHISVLWWNQFGTISLSPLALIIGVSIARCHSSQSQSQTSKQAK